MIDEAPLERLAGLIAASPHNLVSSRQRERSALRAHLEESLAVGRYLAIADAERWLDLGTGGGIPGLVLAMQYPAVQWVLLDSVEKKVQAVKGFAAALGLENVTVVTGRAESVARDTGMREAFDGVVARAVAPLVVLAELARGFVRDGGRLAAVKGPAWAEEASEARWALDMLRWGEVHGQRLEATTRPTWVVTMRASGRVPAEVPRRAGVVARRPLTPRGKATQR